MYNLTPLLTSVAGCSATIIAIIGGFMVRKLIAMSTERHELTTKLAELNAFDEVNAQLREQNPDMLFTEEELQKRIQSPAVREWILSRPEWKEFKRSQLEDRLEAIRDPRGMKRGLLIFVVYSILGVLVPLSLIPFETDSRPVFLAVKWTILGLLTLCLIFVYYYLLYLLRWKQKEVVSRWREYFHPEKNSDE